MTDETHWLSVPDFADALGVTASEVRELIRERHVIAVRRGPSDAWHLPAGFIEEHEGVTRVLPTLRGTLTVLADAGFSDEDAVAWLLADSDELGMAPLAALRDGRRAPVRRAAQALL